MKVVGAFHCLRKGCEGKALGIWDQYCQMSWIETKTFEGMKVKYMFVALHFTALFPQLFT